MLSAAEKINLTSYWRPPFVLGSPVVRRWNPDLTPLDIIAEYTDLPDNFFEDGEIVINGRVLNRMEWDSKVSAGSEISFHIPMQGGGSGKKITAVVAAVALATVTYGISSGTLLTTTSATIGSSLGISSAAGAALLAGGTAIVGALVLSALSGPPVSRGGTRTDSGNLNDTSKGVNILGKASLEGNVLEPNAPIPRVLGQHRMYPPFVCEPLTEVIDQDEITTGIMALSGPHEITDMRIGNAAITSGTTDSDISLEVFDGKEGSTPIEIPQRYSRTFNISVEMTSHNTDPEDQASYAGSIPLWHSMTSAKAPDEVWVHLIMSGLFDQTDTSLLFRTPFRMRMRKKGETDWRYLPEFHYKDGTQKNKRLQVKIFFEAPPVGIPIPPSASGFVEARKKSPGQDVDPIGVDYEADPYFSLGTGNDYLVTGTSGTTNLYATHILNNEVRIFLDPAEWEEGAYDIEIKRGAAFLDSDYATATYTYDGSILDFFATQDSGELPYSREKLIDRFQLVRCVSVKNHSPISTGNLALIKISARNRAVERFSILAGAVMPVYSGGNWNTMDISRNPADQYLHVLKDIYNSDAIPEEIIDMDTIEEWHERCDTMGFYSDIVAEGNNTGEILRLIASCGYGRPYQSEVWGVVQDYDRSAEDPVQLFSPRNSSSLVWKKPFGRIPAGFRINYNDEDYDYQAKQVNVYLAGAIEGDGRIEQTTYEGITNKKKVIQRARFDLLQATHRAAIYSLTAPAENLRCRKGSLVLVDHESLNKVYGSARIKAVLKNQDGDIYGIQIDEKIKVIEDEVFSNITSVLEITSMADAGTQMAVIIRRTSGDFSTHALKASNGTSQVIEFETPIPVQLTVGSFFDKGNIPEIQAGCLVTFGELNTERKRFIVSNIESSTGLNASVTLINEAPEIWENFDDYT